MTMEKSKKPSNGRRAKKPRGEGGRYVKAEPEGRPVVNKHGKGRTYTEAEVKDMMAAIADKPAPTEAPAVALPIKRSQHCLKHDTMMIGGKCRRCAWEKNPKRKAKTSPRLDNRNVERKDTGETLEM